MIWMQAREDTMKAKSIVLLVMGLAAILAGPAAAQDTLGDLVAQGGYDWLAGRWVATTDEGQEVTFEQRWVLDRHAIVSSFQMGDLAYQGLIVYVPYREEILQIGADNKGGAWSGVWRDEYGTAVYRMERKQPDGEIQRAEIVHSRIDVDTLKATMYPIESNGYRASQPWATLTYKRQKAGAPQAAAPSAGWTSRMTLGDLLAQYGYDSMIGRWAGRNEQVDGEIDVQYTWALDKNAVLVEAKMGQFEYRGMITLAPSGEEVVQVGADNMGGTWKSTWTESYDGVVNRHEMRRPDGTVQRIEHVYSQIGKDGFKVTEYGVAAGGYRESGSGSATTFKRRTEMSGK